MNARDLDLGIFVALCVATVAVFVLFLLAVGTDSWSLLLGLGLLGFGGLIGAIWFHDRIESEWQAHQLQEEARAAARSNVHTQELESEYWRSEPSRGGGQ